MVRRAEGNLVLDLFQESMAKKRIHNPQTGKYMKIREQTTSKSNKGQMVSGYSAKTADTINEKFSKAIIKLSTK